MISAANLAQPSGYMRPVIFGHQIMHAAEVGHDRATHHDVVEVRDDKVGVVHVHIDRQRRQKQAGQARRW